MADDDLRVIACHESGHFVADYLLRNHVAAILSIRRVAAHHGVNVGAGRRIDFGGHDRDAPLFAQDPGFRAVVEAAIVAALAGRVAEALAGRLAAYEEPDDDRAAERVAASLAEQSPRDLELLAAAEARPAPGPTDWQESDDAEAAELGFRMVGLEASAYVAWLAAVARRFVHRNADLIVPVAAELLRVTVMSGANAAAIVNQALAERTRT